MISGFVALLFRSVGVLLCVAGTHLTWKERLFCVIAYLPKATVQAAIGPSDEYISYLMTVDELIFSDEIDCRDLFPGENKRERIVVFEVG